MGKNLVPWARHGVPEVHTRPVWHEEQSLVVILGSRGRDATVSKHSFGVLETRCQAPWAVKVTGRLYLAPSGSSLVGPSGD